MTDELKGMGGWLLFFTVSLTIRPVLNLISALGALGLMATRPEAGGVLGLLAVTSVAMAVYTAWMAYVFWKLKPNAVQLLRRYFGVLLVYCLVLAGIGLLPHESTPETAEFLSGAARTALGGIVYIAVWTSYFRKSRRVASTFGQPIATA